MSSEFIAEKIATHMAVADKPDMCQVGNSVCAFVSFVTLDQAKDLRGNPDPTQGQGAPVFHMGSYVPKSQGNAGIGVRSGGQSGPFNPQEHSETVRSQGEFQVHDGHVGQINAAAPGSLAGNTTAVVNAGSTGGGEVDVCITKLKLQLANLKEKIAAEWANSPRSFLWETAKGMGSGAVDAGAGMVDGAKSFFGGMWDAVSSPLETARSAYDSVTGGAKEVYDLGSALYNGDLTVDDIVDGIADALMDALGAAACSVADQLQEMLNKPNGGAEGLGYLIGQVSAQVGAAALTAGAGAAGQAALKGTQVAKLAGEAGEFAMRKGESIAAFFKRLKEKRRSRRHREEPEGGVHGKGGSSNDGNPANPGCRIACERVAHPVNPMYGCKYLAGPEDEDFVLPGLPSIVWQRSYFSDVDRIGAFGQGWTLPYDMRIERRGTRYTFVDTQCRKVPLPELSAGKLRWVMGEDMLFGGLRDLSVLVLVNAAGQSMHFDRTGEDRWRLGRISDGHDNTLSLQWTESGQLAAVTSDAQRRVELDYAETPAGPRVVGVHEVSGRNTRRVLAIYRYSPEGDLSQVCDRTGNVMREFEWRNHIMVMHRQPGGLESRYEYDVYTAQGKVVRTWDSMGRAWQLIYRDGETRVVDSMRRSVRYRYDDAYRLTARIDAQGREARYDLDRDGNLVSQTDEAGRTTRYARNGNGLPILITKPDGAQTFIEYHARFPWLPIAVTDALGHTTCFEYDDRGSLSARVDALGGRTEYYRDGRGLAIRIRDARGGTRHLSYAEDGQPVSHIDCSGSRTRYEYDDQGRLLAIVDPLGGTTRYRYDAVGRPTVIEHADGAAEHFGYDVLGRLTAHGSPGGAVTRYVLAPDGRPVERRNALGHALHYRYDGMRRLSSLVNENGAEHSLAYDVLDRIVEQRSFDGTRIRYQYGADGAVAEQEEFGQEAGGASSIRTRYRRDAVGRILEIAAARTHGRQYERSRYEYDAVGNLVRAVNSAGTLARRYDPVGQMVEEVSDVAGISQRLTYEYDLLGNCLQTVLPDGRAINRLYYGSGHLHQINVDGQVVTDLERDALHREQRRTQGVLESRYQYDARGRLAAQFAERPVGDGLMSEQVPSGATTSDTIRISRQYQYDRDGNPVQVQDAYYGSTLYAYDAIGRLQQANDERFFFDPASNILDGRHSPQAGGADAAVRDNRVRFYQGQRYVYDTYGNVVEKQIGQHTAMRFEYDPHHRMISAEVTRQGVVQRYRYAYDALGRRVIKRDLFGTTRFLWDGDSLLAESRARRTCVYLYGDDAFVPVAQLASHGQSEPCRILHYHVDHIGTARELTDENGSVVWRARYTAWGQTAGADTAGASEQVWPSPQPLRFQGQYHDLETGLYYNRYRYYDSHFGRFVSKDPIGLEGGLNVYQYAPNPTQWIDPLGLARIPASVKSKVAQENEAFFGVEKCECCGVETVPGKKSKRGEVPPSNERQFDHITADSKDGANDEGNTQLLCRKCNRGFSNHDKPNFKQLNRLGRTPCLGD